VYNYPELTYVQEIFRRFSNFQYYIDEITPHSIRSMLVEILNPDIELAAFMYKLSRLQNAETGVEVDDSDPSQEL
jgi:hypothetical protein